MDKQPFAAARVAERLNAALDGKGGNDAIALALKQRTGLEISGETMRKARAALTQHIAHDLLAAVAVTYGVDVGWLMTGERKDEKKGPTVEEVRAELARFRENPKAADGVSWVPRLLEQVLESSEEVRVKLALFEAILAAGRIHAMYGEAMAAVQRGVVLEGEVTAADGRNDTNRLAETNAAARADAVRDITSGQRDVGGRVRDDSILDTVLHPPQPERAKAAGE